MNFTTCHWHYLHGKPSARGMIKAVPEDFVVVEELGYSPCGEGEHIYLWVEKQGLNTAYVAEQLAKYSGLPLRAVTYAGRKDKFAVTRQWFGVHKPGKTDIDWTALTLPGLKILNAVRHNKKLRTGVLKGNRFELRVTGLSEQDGISERLLLAANKGVPNYFGSQRFGNTRHHSQGGNLHLAESLVAGEQIRNRNKRSMAISALRAWLFNEFIHHRIERDLWNRPVQGDVMVLSGSNSFFIAEQDLAAAEIRMEQKDIALSAPMWGSGQPDSTMEALKFESDIAGAHQGVCETLAALGLKQERRAISLFPKDMQWQLSDDSLELQFSLPAGAFATSVLREIVQLGEVEETE